MKYLSLVVILVFAQFVKGEVSFMINPLEPKIDEVVEIKIEGLNPSESYLLQLQSVKSDNDGFWKSSAFFEADKFGRIDVSSLAPISGDYQGVDEMGLFWSLNWLSTEQDLPDLNKVYHLELSVLDSSNQLVLQKEVVRKSCFDDPNIKREILDESGLAATVFYRKSSKKLPTVLVLSGSEGGKNESLACQLADKGFVAVALAYFGYEGLPKKLMQIPLEYFAESLKKLENHEVIDLNRLAVVGGSKGGELALLLGATYSDYKAVLASVPSAVVWNGIDPSGDGPIRSSWTFRGKDIPFSTFGAENVDWGNPPFSLREGYSVPLVDNEHVKLSAIPVEKVSGPIMIISGDDDQMWPSSTFGDMITARLAGFDFVYEYQHLRYSKAGHYIPAGYWPATIKTFMPFSMGGTSKGTAHAGIDSWVKIVRFLRGALNVE